MILEVPGVELDLWEAMSWMQCSAPGNMLNVYVLYNMAIYYRLLLSTFLPPKFSPSDGKKLVASKPRSPATLMPGGDRTGAFIRAVDDDTCGDVTSGLEVHVSTPNSIN